LRGRPITKFRIDDFASPNRNLLRKRILFVDDEAGIRLTLPHILVKHGFEVTSAASVDEAVKEIKARKFDALLSDLNLPQPNEGFVVIRAMRQHQPRCVNFVLTGYPGDASADKAVEQQVAHYFTKPVDIAELVRTIMDKLGSPGKD
jgi:DNA-binding NtrC family response regulator